MLLVSVLFQRSLTFLILVGGIGGLGGIKMVSASTLSANGPANGPAGPHFSPAQTLGRMVSSGISDAVIASVYSEKTRLKKLMMNIILINRKKQWFLAVTRN